MGILERLRLLKYVRKCWEARNIRLAENKEEPVPAQRQNRRVISRERYAVSCNSRSPEESAQATHDSIAGLIRRQ